MVAARNLESSFTAQRQSSDGRNYRTTAKIISGTRGHDFLTYPRYDSRHAVRYARSLLAQANMWSELEEEARQDNVRDIRARRLDTVSAVFARQLEYIFREPLKAVYPDLRATEFIPVNTEVPPDAQTFTYRMMDITGQAKIVNETADDWPAVDLGAEETQAPVVTIGASYSYSILEAMRAARLGASIDAWKGEAARYAIEFLIEKIAAVGDANSGVVGLTNFPGLSATAQKSVGGSWIEQVNAIGAATTNNATNPAAVALQGIGSDIGAMIQKVRTQSKGKYRINTVLVGNNVYGALESAPKSALFGQSGSLLEFLETTFRVDIDFWTQLDTAGAVNVGGNQGRVMAYMKDPKNLRLIYPQMFTQLPPQFVNMKAKIGCWARCGGVMVPYPLAFTYMDGVS